MTEWLWVNTWVCGSENRESSLPSSYPISPTAIRLRRPVRRPWWATLTQPEHRFDRQPHPAVLVSQSISTKLSNNNNNNNSFKLLEHSAYEVMSSEVPACTPNEVHCYLLNRIVAKVNQLTTVCSLAASFFPRDQEERRSSCAKLANNLTSLFQSIAASMAVWLPKTPKTALPHGYGYLCYHHHRYHSYQNHASAVQLPLQPPQRCHLVACGGDGLDRHTTAAGTDVRSTPTEWVSERLHSAVRCNRSTNNNLPTPPPLQVAADFRIKSPPKITQAPHKSQIQWWWRRYLILPPVMTPLNPL